MGGQFTHRSALGVLSLIIWTLIITISIKYCLFVCAPTIAGEGGILALMSLIGANGFTPGPRLLTGMGLLGAALIYGDGVITPAISVLSALEGVNVVTSTLKPFVMPMAVVILRGAFRRATLRHGKDRPRVRSDDAVVVRGHCRARHRVDRTASACACGGRSALRHALHDRSRAAPDFWCWAACSCASPAARRCTPTWVTSARSDTPLLVSHRAAGAAVELCRADRVSVGSRHGERQSVLPDRACLVRLPAGRAGHHCDHHCQPGHHHRFVLDDASGDATRLAAGSCHPSDLGPASTARSTSPRSTG